jgi:DNA ligase-associated metallophosphoesterase
MLNLKPERYSVEEFAEQPVSVCGKVFIADMSGALYWPAENALIVADLHLEKGSAFAARGQMLPPYDTRETLQRLARAIDRFGADTVIALGDSLHDPAGADRIDPTDLETLAMMQEDRTWIWVTGNHDPEISSVLGGEIEHELLIAGLMLRHEPRATRVTHEIAGHMHPAARINMNGFSIRRPCFVGNGLRLILPAFGAYAGGLNILDEAFAPMFGVDGLAVWMLGQEGLYPVAPRLMRED